MQVRIFIIAASLWSGYLLAAGGVIDGTQNIETLTIRTQEETHCGININDISTTVMASDINSEGKKLGDMIITCALSGSGGVAVAIKESSGASASGQFDTSASDGDLKLTIEGGVSSDDNMGISNTIKWQKGELDNNSATFSLIARPARESNPVGASFHSFMIEVATYNS